MGERGPFQALKKPKDLEIWFAYRMIRNRMDWGWKTGYLGAVKGEKSGRGILNTR